MAMSAQAQQPQQHARRQEAADHNSDLLQRTADRSSSVQTDERGFSRNGDRSRRPFWRVKLKVFDISKGMAELYGGFFVSDKKKGIWHTNVVVFGLEYFYVSTICVCPVGMGWPGEEQLKEVLDVGTTERTAFELEAFLRAQQRLFTPNKYDMFKHNCNHFSDLVLRFLNHRLRVPSYIASLPERVLQTTLGKLVYPLVNAAMDRTKSDICQHADKAELCGEIFFYGGATPLLVPGERSTQILMKRVVEEFKQQQLDAVAHRSSTAAYRSKSSYRRDRQADGSAFLGSRNNNQRAAAVAAFYSDAVLARRKDRARCTGGNESRVWPSPQPRGEPHLQQLRQQQIQQVQLRPGRATKEFQSGKACPGRGTLEGGTTAAVGDVVPARIHEGFSSATGEDSSVPGGATAFNKEEGHFTGGGAPPPAATTHDVDERRYRLENWLTSSVLSECHRQPQTSQRRRSHVSPSPHASRPKTEDAEGAQRPRRREKQQQTSCGSRNNSSRKDLFLRCQWRSHADFLHSADDARSGAAGAASAAVPRQTHQPAARRLRGISSAKWSDSSGSSQSSTHGNPLFVSTASPERVCRHAEGHAAGHATAPTRDAVRNSGDTVAAGEKATTWSSVRGPPTQLHRSPRGADACLRDGRPTGAGKGRSTVGVSIKPAAEVTAIRHPPFSPVSSSSTTVGSRLSTQSSRKGTFTSGGSRSGAYARNASECSPFTVAPKGVKSRALQRFLPHAEDGLAGDRMGWFPLQSLRLRRPQTTEDTDVTERARTRGYFQPPAASGAVAAERRSASDFSGSTSITKPGSWSCEARRDTGGIYPPTTRQGSVGGRSRSSDCSRSSDGGPPEDDLRCNRRPLLSLQHHHADAAYDAASEEADAAEKERMSRDGGFCGNRRHTVTSGRLAPAEGDVGVEDASGSRQSSKYSSFSEPHDSCDGRETEWLQQQEWLPPAEEKQFEQQDQARRLQATELDVTRNTEKQGLFLVSPEGCRISLAAGNTHSGLSSPLPHDPSALRRGLQWNSHMRGRRPEHSSGTSIPRVRSGSCSDVRTTDVVRRDRAPGRGCKFSATGDGVDSSAWPANLIRRRSASADSAFGESEPEWEDADEQEGTEESEKVDEESQSVKLWLPAVATRPPALRETGNAEDSSDSSEGQGMPADSNFPLKCSTSTVRPTPNSPSFESASDCCFLESAHEDDEVEGKEEFQEAKEERTSSDDEEQDTQRAEGIAELGCEGSVSYSDDGGLVKRCVPSFLTPPAVPWQRGGRDGRARFTRQSPGKTYVAERQTPVASGVEEAGGREERRATSPTTCSDWWQQQDQRDRNAARSSTFFPETRTEVAAIHQAPFVQREQEESLKEDFEQIRASFFPPASPAFTPR